MKTGDRQSNYSSLVAIGLLIVVGLACGQSTTRTTKPHVVTYQVTDTNTDSASITYNNAGGDTEQTDASLPWTKTFNVRDGEFLYVSAQRHPIDVGDYATSGTITAKILIDGKVAKSTNSDGQYVIASASMRCCE